MRNDVGMFIARAQAQGMLAWLTGAVWMQHLVVAFHALQVRI